MSKIQINGDLTQNSKNGNNPVTLNITGGGVSGGGSVSSGFIFDTSAIQLKADKISVRKSSSNTPVAIENIAIPTTDYQAANKKYVDDAVAGGEGGGEYLPLAGGTMDNMASIIMNDAGTRATLMGSEVRLNNTETLASNTLTSNSLSIYEPNTDLMANLSTAGLEFSGNATVSGLATPTADNQAANKQYVDNAVASSGGGVTFLGEGGTNTAHFFAFDLGSAVMLVGRFLNASFGNSKEFTVGIDLGVSPSSFNAMIPITYYNNTASESSGTILTLSGSGSNTVVRCTTNTKSYNGSGCFTAIFVK